MTTLLAGEYRALQNGYRMKDGKPPCIIFVWPSRLARRPKKTAMIFSRGGRVFWDHSMIALMWISRAKETSCDAPDLVEKLPVRANYLCH
jgi:hypothetical protein